MKTKSSDKIKKYYILNLLSLPTFILKRFNILYSNDDYSDSKNFSALPGVSNSHKDATTHPGAKISL